ncbi:MAG: nucleotidyltransferase domain-containing protein [Syntrophaceticus sp.]|nr:nucleotidyltransferase domain-containing protein [Syntrophaceticus sp.]MDD4360262.1 nucleotidyltransferase domain-containing protein [Syntrophaceticus sp.]
MTINKLYKKDFADFCKAHGIALAILFGSRATGKAKPKSDIDLGVCLTTPTRQHRALQSDLIHFLKTDTIDLVILNYASPLLKFQVAKTGKPLYQEEPGAFAAYCSLALRQHSDAKLFYQATDSYLNRLIKERK